MPRRAAHQAEECESIPLHASHLPSHGAKRLIEALLIAKALLQHFPRHALALKLAAQPGAWCRQPGIALPLSYRPGQLLQKGLWRANPEVGLLGQGTSTLSGPLGQVAFGVGLQTPSDAPHQELLVVRPRLLPKHFQVLYPQLAYTLVSQGVNFAPLRCVFRSF